MARGVSIPANRLLQASRPCWRSSYLSRPWFWHRCAEAELLGCQEPELVRDAA